MHKSIILRLMMLLVKRILTSRRLRSARLFLAACILIFFWNASIDFFQRPPAFARRQRVAADQLSPHVGSVYIASAQYNSEAILREHWLPSLVELVKALQVANITVYVSIYENHSVDGTKAILSQVAEKLRNLNVETTIYLDTETRDAVIEKVISSPTGWLRTPYGKELRRIVYLADVRNRALNPLYALNKAGIKFDRLLFLNDVIYSVRFRGLSRR